MIDSGVVWRICFLLSLFLAGVLFLCPFEAVAASQESQFYDSQAGSSQEIEISAESEEPDYIKGVITGIISGLLGTFGDVFVALCFIGMLLMIWKKKFKGAVGFLILIVGLVFVRVVTSILFGTDKF